MWFESYVQKYKYIRLVFVVISPFELKNCIFFFWLIFANSYNIDQHDYDVRLRAARKFLKDGDTVVLIFFLFLLFVLHTF